MAQIETKSIDSKLRIAYKKDAQRSDHPIVEDFESMLRQIENRVNVNSFKNTEYFTYSNISGLHRIPLSTICYVHADSNYVEIVLADKTKIVLARTLKSIEIELRSFGFVRCHQSYLVNNKHILSFEKNALLILDNGDRIPVSRRKKKSIRALCF